MTRRGENCTGCCGGCGRHFTSQTAFDLHRIHEKRAGKSTWYCADPSELKVLEQATATGCCRIPPNNDMAAIIWKVAGSSERFADVFGEAA